MPRTWGQLGGSQTAPHVRSAGGASLRAVAESCSRSATSSGRTGRLLKPSQNTGLLFRIYWTRPRRPPKQPLAYGGPVPLTLGPPCPSRRDGRRVTYRASLFEVCVAAAKNGPLPSLQSPDALRPAALKETRTSDGHRPTPPINLNTFKLRHLRPPGPPASRRSRRTSRKLASPPRRSDLRPTAAHDYFAVAAESQRPFVGP